MLLGSKLHTAGDSRRWIIDYSRWLDNTATIDSAVVSSSSDTCNDAGTLRIGHDVDWTNDTTPVGSGSRPGLTRIAGIWTNQAAITNGPAINRGTYVGTTRSNASSQLDWIYGTAALNGGAAFLNVWNAYNRVDVGTKVSDTTTTWFYGTATIRAVNGSNSNRVSFVSGLAEDSFSASYWVAATINSTCSGSVGIGIDSTTAFFGPAGWARDLSQTLSVVSECNPVLGAHYAQANEWGAAAAGATFNGDSSITGQALMFKFKM